jgi:pyruvate/2-oxoglutarate dehydrogenase complex dihydrolipoamide acyltransferase (E2) component
VSAQLSSAGVLALLRALRARADLQAAAQPAAQRRPAVAAAASAPPSRATAPAPRHHASPAPARPARRNEFDAAISETEGAYMKILESSQTLLSVLKRESTLLTKKKTGV